MAASMASKASRKPYSKGKKTIIPVQRELIQGGALLCLREMSDLRFQLFKNFRTLAQNKGKVCGNCKSCYDIIAQILYSSEDFDGFQKAIHINAHDAIQAAGLTDKALVNLDLLFSGESVEFGQWCNACTSSFEWETRHICSREATCSLANKCAKHTLKPYY